MKTDICFKRYVNNDFSQKKEIDLYVGGDKRWFLNSNVHRVDGPAYEGHYGYKEWWLEGDYYPEQKDYWMALKKYKRNKSNENRHLFQKIH